LTALQGVSAPPWPASCADAKVQDEHSSRGAGAAGQEAVVSCTLLGTEVQVAMIGLTGEDAGHARAAYPLRTGGLQPHLDQRSLPLHLVHGARAAARVRDPQYSDEITMSLARIVAQRVGADQGPAARVR
jgi:hypothetical protein